MNTKSLQFREIIRHTGDAENRIPSVPNFDEGRASESHRNNADQHDQWLSSASYLLLLASAVAAFLLLASNWSYSSSGVVCSAVTAAAAAADPSAAGDDKGTAFFQSTESSPYTNQSMEPGPEKQPSNEKVQKPENSDRGPQL